MNQQTYTDIEVKDLLSTASRMKDAGQRLVQICCTKLPDRLEIHYSFDKDYAFTSFRLTLKDNSTIVPSISKVYWNSFHYENEIHDLFGIKVEGNVVDYQGNFYRTAIKTPFNIATPAAEGEKKS
ncbi:MAG: NADH-quinone oxidoreductase subunit C [Candidatus Omnitrophica bacterium]|nr:NADH-quinone oxidoreductase subunit C [Candidatus Omnitrophota bacterium]